MKRLAAVRQGLGRDARTIVIATAVASVVTAAPAVANMVANADKVDGKHAVSSKAAVDARKGKLVATDKKTGRLPNDIIAKAPNADRLDGLDSGDLQVTSGGKSGQYPNIHGCGQDTVLSYPLEVTRDSQILAAGTSGISVPENGFKPSITTELVNAQDQVVATSSRVIHTGEGGNWSLTVTEVLMTAQNPIVPFEAAPGEYTLRLFGNNYGPCDNTKYVQYQGPRLSHLLVPAGR